MTRTIFFIAMMIGTLSCDMKVQKTTSPEFFKDLNSLYSSQDFFTLRSKFESESGTLSEVDVLYFHALIANVFNQQSASNEAISTLLKGHKVDLTEVQLCEIYQAKLLNHLNQYEYALAAETNKVLLEKYTALLDEQKITDLKNELGIWEALKSTSKQEVVKTDDVTIPVTKDRASLMNVDVAFSGKVRNFIFDTGANFSVIKRSLVEELGLRIIEADFYVTAATGAKVDSDLAIAEELTIGGIVCRNVVFLILEDKDFSFPQIDYFPNGAIGFPVIEAFDEIHFNRDGHLFVPKTSEKYAHNNLALDGLMPIVEGGHGNDSLRFNFDTGAMTTSLYPAFYEKYKSTLEEQYHKETFLSGSAGGEFEFEGHIIPEFLLTIAGNSAQLDSLQLYIEDIGGEKSHVHGNFGQDFIKQFDKMIVSFRHSAVVFE